MPAEGNAIASSLKISTCKSCQFDTLPKNLPSPSKLGWAGAGFWITAVVSGDGGAVRGGEDNLLPTEPLGAGSAGCSPALLHAREAAAWRWAFYPAGRLPCCSRLSVFAVLNSKCSRLLLFPPVWPRLHRGAEGVELLTGCGCSAAALYLGATPGARPALSIPPASRSSSRGGFTCRAVSLSR